MMSVVVFYYSARRATTGSTLVARRPAFAKASARLTVWLFSAECIDGVDTRGSLRGEPAGEGG